ncbi:hypothetical protein ACM26W_04375 [Halomonas sp. HK25]|uniref:hypothetical protein n=1 Tax=Halomonas sp. HK25 TaxID=3394321 RepID=UPI0039FCF9A4
MNKNQVEDSASNEKSKKVSDDKRTEQKGDAQKQGGKDGAVLKDINDNARKDKK